MLARVVVQLLHLNILEHRLRRPPLPGTAATPSPESMSDHVQYTLYIQVCQTEKNNSDHWAKKVI